MASVDIKSIPLKSLANVVLQDEGGAVSASGKWPLVIDPSGRAATFFQYQHTNYTNCLSPGEMEEDRLRKSILGAVRYGKAVVLDIGDMDNLSGVSAKMDCIKSGLLAAILDKSFIEKETYLSLVKDSDGPEYHESQYGMAAEFTFIVVTKNASPNKGTLEATFPVSVMS